MVIPRKKAAPVIIILELYTLRTTGPVPAEINTNYHRYAVLRDPINSVGTDPVAVDGINGL